MLDHQLLPRYGAAVGFEHRDFPLPKHAWARPAAIAARFFEEAQPEVGLAYRKYVLANLRHINPDNFNERLSQFARERGVDPDQAVAALNDKRLAALVDQEYQDGVARGIARTPTIIVNGTPFVETFTFEQVAKAIDASLAASK
jgi:2-hydroxychromene-2-carboxylate isomerase